MLARVRQGALDLHPHGYGSKPKVLSPLGDNYHPSAVDLCEGFLGVQCSPDSRGAKKPTLTSFQNRFAQARATTSFCMCQGSRNPSALRERRRAWAWVCLEGASV